MNKKTAYFTLLIVVVLSISTYFIITLNKTHKGIYVSEDGSDTLYLYDDYYKSSLQFGYCTFKGRYKIEGNKIIFYEIKRTCSDLGALEVYQLSKGLFNNYIYTNYDKSNYYVSIN